MIPEEHTIEMHRVYVALEKAQAEAAFINAFINGAHRDSDGFRRMRTIAEQAETEGWA